MRMWSQISSSQAMDKTFLLEKQMRYIGETISRFDSNLKAVKNHSLSKQFIIDGAALIKLLNGEANAGTGLEQAIRDLPRDVGAIHDFLKKWKDYREVDSYTTVLGSAQDLYKALVEFRDTINGLTKSERSYATNTAKMGRLITDRDLKRTNSQYNKSHVMSEERYRPFIVSAFVGCILWSFIGGFFHAYVICINWDVISAQQINMIFSAQPFIALVCAGFVFGLSIEIAKFIGAVFRSDGLTVFLPILVGAVVGALQASLIVTKWWGFEPQIVFRSEGIRLLTGVVCGFVMCPPTLRIGIFIRRRGRPW